MKPSYIAKLVLLPLLALATLVARAEDIDLYAGSTANGSAPNLLIVLDNASAWNANQSYACTGFTVPANNVGKNVGFEQCGLYNAVNAIGNSTSLLNNIKLGLMYFPLTSDSAKDGGKFVLPAPSPAPSSLLLMDSSGIATMKSTITALDATASNSNNNQIPQAMQEAWAFYQGQTGLSGTHYPGTNAGSTCGRNYVVYITLATTNTKPQDPGNVGQNALTTASGAAQPALAMPAWPGASGKYQSDYGDEWAKFMYSGTTANANLTYPSITTYTIILTDGSNPNYEQYMVGMAEAGGGKYFLVKLGDTSGLAQALLAIFNEVQAVNSVFASPGLPVTANAQGTYLNQIFMASFRPDADGKPRWLGNLKQYQFGVNTAGLHTTPATGVSLFLADSSWANIDITTGLPTYPQYTNAYSALSSAGTGFVSPNAISFWTTRDTTTSPDSIGGFWVNKPGIGGGYDLSDGQYVEKGGVSQQIRLAQLKDTYTGTTPTTSRPLYTCFPAASCTSTAPLSGMPFKDSNTNLTAAALGITNPVYTASIGSISRTPTQVTVTLAATPSPSITNPSTIVISGTTGGQFDGALSTLSPTVIGSTITYTLPQEKPGTPAGAYNATGVTTSQSSVSTLTRTTNSGWITASAALADTTFGGGAAVAVNDVISISGSTGYDGGNYTVTNVAGSTVQFKMQGSPSPYDGGATLWVGNSSNNNNSATSGTAGAYATGTPTGLIRGTNCTGCSPAALGQVLMVNIPGGTTNSFVTGNKVKISGSTSYNSATGYPIIGVGTSCKVDVTTSSSGTVTTYTGTANVVTTSPSKTTTYTFCLDLGSSFPYSPSLTSNGASGTTKASRSGAGATKPVLGIVRAASTCPASNLATATVTSTAHGFTSGSSVTIGRSDGGTNEGYNGAYTISNVTANTFDIQVPTTPSCTNNTGSISYQSSANGSVSASTLINWVRGQDSIGDESSPLNGMTVRGSVHGDVLHSRPTVINYGGTTGIVVFYGANDGVFRAINGNQPPSSNTRPAGTVAANAATYTPKGGCSITGNSTCTIGGVPPGGELWGFIPSEFYPKLQRLYSNSPDIQLATTPTGILPTPVPKDYFLDGPTATYQTYDSSGNTTGAYIFLTARRGGRVIYAFDVTSPTNPKFMWKHNGADSTDTGFAELGQTWSLPKVAFVKGYMDTSTTPAKPKPVLIFGAGYDGNSYDNSAGTTYLGHDDADPPTAATMGRGIFIVDAMSGALVWRAGPGGSPSIPPAPVCAGNPCLSPGITSSIAADITAVDTNFDGYVDRLYATDTGGNIWRVDLETSPTASPAYGAATWQVTKLAALGGTVSTGTPRKFLFSPDVVLTKNFAAVLAGTGDREHPLQVQAATYNTINRFYMVLDTVTGADSSAWTTVVDDSNTSGAAAPSQGNLFNATSTPFNITTSTCSGTGGCKGYYLVLNGNPQSTAVGASTLGEQVVNAPTTIGGFTYFGTNQPKPADTDSCSANLGNARGYKVGFLTGSGGFTLFDGGGLPPTPVAGLVLVNVNGTETAVPFLLGGGGGATSGSIGGGAPETCSGPDCKSASGGQKVPVPIPVKKKRTYWYRQIDQ